MLFLLFFCSTVEENREFIVFNTIVIVFNTIERWRVKVEVEDIHYCVKDGEMKLSFCSFQDC